MKIGGRIDDSPEARKAFAQIAIQLDNVVSDAGHYISTHTDFNKETSEEYDENGEMK